MHLFGIVCSVLQIEAQGQLEVELDGPALMLST